MRNSRPLTATRSVAVMSVCLLTASAQAAPDFAKDVRPILEKNCFSCHGPEKHRNGYRLDVRSIALKGGDSGETAIVPHNSKASPFFRYVSGADAKTVMPPKNSPGPRPSAEEVETLRAWIDAGPSWPDEFAGATSEVKPHWALQPLVKPAVPPDSSANPVDAFVRTKLSAKSLVPSPEADPRTLIRRVYYDLIGLPPTPEETETFTKAMDHSHSKSERDQAWSSLVDSLLASPRYGERWARHWLDTIHFADSHGFEHDVGRDNAWPFRDYVIASLNGDKPWGRFVREQLAADYFYPDQPELTPALGYLGAGTFDLSAFSTAPVMFEYIDRDDMVTQTMSAFVSTTANCARCHAHKFDPIPQEDYYALQAVFAGLIKGDISYDADPATYKERQHWMAVQSAAERKDATVLLAPENEPLVTAWITQHAGTTRWQPLEVETLLSAESAVLTATTVTAPAETNNKVYLASGPRPDKDTYTITGTTTLPEITAIRLNVLADGSLPMNGPGRQDNGNLHLSEFEARLFETGSDKPRGLKFSGATADFNQEGWDIQRALDGKIETAWGIHPAEGQSHYAVFTLAEKVALKGGARLEISLKQAHGTGHLIGAFNLSVTGDKVEQIAALPVAVDSALTVPAAERTSAQRTLIAASALQQMAVAALKKLQPPSQVYSAAPSVRIPSSEGGEFQNKSLAEPPAVHLMHRGEFDKPREVIPPGALSALQHLPARFALKDPKNTGQRRAALADWIAHPDNVLTWRSIVNRVWQYHFGRGLCDTPSDFGRMGDLPVNPELIDWLAVWFRDDAKGSLKQLHRLIVTSATWRQASATNEAAAKIDSDNRLLWRQNVHRLDADSYRDFALAVSGKLDLTMGGPPVQNFKRSKGPQATPALDYSAYDWNSPGAGRRSIYRCVWRGIADPFMEALDFPDLGLLAPVRGFSASSLQALTLYNNNFVLAGSEAFAKRAEKDTPSLEAQVAQAVRLVWLRAPKHTEQQDFTTFARANGLPALCRLLLNSDEFLFVD